MASHTCKVYIRIRYLSSQVGVVMNRIFKLKFNKTNSELVVCSELATSAAATTEQQATPAKFLSNLKLAVTGVALIAASVASVQANDNVVPVSVEAVKQSVTVLDSLHDAIGEQAEKVKATLVKPFAEPEPQPATDLAGMGDVLDAMSRDFSDLKAAIQDKVELPQEVKEQLAQDTARVEAPAEKPAPEVPEQHVVKDFDLGGFADSVASLTKDLEGKVTLPQEVKEQLAQDTAKVESPAEKPAAPEASAPADTKEFDNDAFASDVADLAKKLAGTLPLVQEVKAEIAKDTANSEAAEQPAPAQPAEKDAVAEVVKQLPELHDTVGELANKLADTLPLVKEVQEVIATETANAEAPAQPAPAQPEAKEFDSDAFAADVSDLAKKLAGTLPLTQEVKAEISKDTANSEAAEQPAAPAQPAQEDKVAQAVKQLPELHDAIGDLADKLKDHVNSWEAFAPTEEPAPAPAQPAEPKELPAELPPVDNSLLNSVKGSTAEQLGSDMSDLAEKLKPLFPAPATEEEPKAPEAENTPVEPQPVPTPVEDNNEPVVTQPTEDNTAPVVGGENKEEVEQPVVDGENNQAQPDVPVVDGTDNSEVEQPVVDGGDKTEGEQPVVDGENNQAQPEVPVVDGTDDSDVEKPAVEEDTTTEPVVPAEPEVPAVEPEEPKAEVVQPSDAAEPEAQPAEQPEAQPEAAQPAQPEATETPELQAGNQGSTNSPEAVTPSNTQPVGPVAAPATTPTVELRSNAAGEVVAVFSNNERFERDNLREFADVAPVETVAAPVARTSAVRLSSTGISYSCQVATDKFIKQYNVNPQDMLQLSALGSLVQKYRVATEDYAAFSSACANATADKWATLIQNNYINKK